MNEGAPKRPRSEVRTGTRLGRYEILVPVAQGGMARVWAARQHGQRGFSKVVAIKTILPTLASDPNFEAMFLDEARLASGIHHPNVCEIFDLGEDNGALYIAMEWVNGEALSRILKPPIKGQKASAQRLDLRIAARIVADAAKGLHAAHELKDDAGEVLNVVHRDVSPQNILVSLDGMVKVTDFGVAKALRPGQESTMAGQIKGKIAYMAPEQARGLNIDRRSDVFALGVVLYEITTGRRPFSGDELQVMKSLATGQFDAPSMVLQGYPRDLEAIVLWSMNLDPARRFPTADAMRHALEDWLLSSGERVTEAHIAALTSERVGHLVEERAQRIRERTRSGTLGSSSGVSAVSAVSAVQAVSNTPGVEEPPAPEVEPPPAPPPSEASSSFMSSAPSVVSSISHTSAPSNTPGPSSVSYVAPVVASAPPMPIPAAAPAAGSPMKTAVAGIAIGLGVFALVAVGGGGWYVMQKRNVAASSPAVTAPVETSAPGQIAQAEVRVRLVEPTSGVTLLIDGMVQPVGVLNFARPAAGATKELTLRAPGYEDKIFHVDATTESIDVTLEKEDAASADTAAARAQEPAPNKVQPQAKADPKSANVPQPVETKASGEKPKDKGKSPAKIDVPDNPF